jgi:hypothetical protein
MAEETQQCWKKTTARGWVRAATRVEEAEVMVLRGWTYGRSSGKRREGEVPTQEIGAKLLANNGSSRQGRVEGAEPATIGLFEINL